MLMESFYGTDVCPNDYPYAYRNGKRCCRYIVDKNKDVLTINSTSCYADDYFDSISCPFEICSTGIFSISYYYVKNFVSRNISGRSLTTFQYYREGWSLHAQPPI